VSTAEQLAAKLSRVAKNIEGVDRDAVNFAARSLQAAAMTNLVAAIGPERRLSGVNTTGTLGVTVKAARAATSPTALVQGFPAGLFTIVEKGAKPHMVGAGRAGNRAVLASNIGSRQVRRVTASGRIGRAVERKLLSLPDGPVYGPFMVSGSPGKTPFTRALNVVGPKVPEIVQRETRKAITTAGFR
jgi:hypothetical protein